MSKTWEKIKERAALRRTARENVIDAHGLSGDGLLGRIGTCSVCKRKNKTVGPLNAKPGEERCIIPSKYRALIDKGEAEVQTGCELQKGDTAMSLKRAQADGRSIRPISPEEMAHRRKRRKMQKDSRRKNRARR